MMGNVVIWKCARSAVYSAHFLREMWREAGLPDGVITLMLGPGGMITDRLVKRREFAGLHFTGSTEVFQSLWKDINKRVTRYNTYPRLVGETGGKDFVFVHNTADVDAVVAALVRGSFEYQGQKCSAASRSYIPASLWPELKKKLLAEIKSIKMGDVEDFRNFMNAVIDQGAFDTIVEYIEYAKSNKKEAKILCGGKYDKSKGYFIEPTVIETTNPKFKTLVDEIFGPVLTLYIYKDAEFAKALKQCDTASPYALTGSIFARDRQAIIEAEEALVGTAGNFYINDKPTGAVVGQQPFGGARASGTNDKAGSAINLLKWCSPRTIKETFDPPRDYRYPFMAEK